MPGPCKCDASSGAHLRLLMAQMPGFHWTTDANLSVTSIWGKDFVLAKIPAETVLGRNICEFLGYGEPNSSPASEYHSALFGVRSQVETVWRGRILEIRLEPLRDSLGEIIGCLGSAVDITDRKKNEEEAHYQACHDALTGLANYREFTNRLEQEVRRAERSHNSFTILLLDLDGLKHINDLHGHLAGNRALQRLAAVMNEHCRSTDLAVRYGGDEFAVILIDSDQGMAEQVAQRIDTGLSADRRKPALSVSIGIGLYPDDGRTAAELIEAADRRLYRYKRSGHRRVLSASANDTAQE